jgi:hypothetical protein
MSQGCMCSGQRICPDPEFGGLSGKLDAKSEVSKLVGYANG